MWIREIPKVGLFCRGCGRDETGCPRDAVRVEDRCCASCWHDGRSRRVELPEPEGSAAVRLGEPLDQGDEDAVVQRLLDAADGGVEQAGAVSVSAYRSLAASRGVPVEDVVRAACRGQLADVVRRPPKTTTTERNPS